MSRCSGGAASVASPSGPVTTTPPAVELLQALCCREVEAIARGQHLRGGRLDGPALSPAAVDPAEPAALLQDGAVAVCVAGVVGGRNAPLGQRGPPERRAVCGEMHDPRAVGGEVQPAVAVQPEADGRPHAPRLPRDAPGEHRVIDEPRRDALLLVVPRHQRHQLRRERAHQLGPQNLATLTPTSGSRSSIVVLFTVCLPSGGGQWLTTSTSPLTMLPVASATWLAACLKITRSPRSGRGESLSAGS